MALNSVLIALTCAVAFPVAALAQSPVQKVAAKADCCATDDGSAAAAAVLLPPMAVTPAEACCQTGVMASTGVDHSAHMPGRAAKSGAPANQSMAGMTCCNHGSGQAGTKMERECCQDMKDGCAMGCCAATPPRH